VPKTGPLQDQYLMRLRAVLEALARSIGLRCQ
jgi:hypothetical protein